MTLTVYANLDLARYVRQDFLGRCFQGGHIHDLKGLASSGGGNVGSPSRRAAAEAVGAAGQLVDRGALQGQKSTCTSPIVTWTDASASIWTAASSKEQKRIPHLPVASSPLSDMQQAW